MSTPVTEITIRKQRLGSTVRRQAAKRRKKIGKAPLRSAFRKLPASTRAKLSRSRSKFMKRFGKKIAALRSSYDFPAMLTGVVKHRPEYIKMVVEGANAVCEDHDDARDFAKFYLAKDPAFSNTDTGMAALLFEVRLVEFTGGLYGVFMETVVHGNEPTFIALFEGKLRKEELERFANDVSEFCTFEIMVRAGQSNYLEGSVSDLTILECTAVPGAKSYKLPPAVGGGAQQFDAGKTMPGGKGKAAADHRMLPRSYEAYESVVEEGGLSDQAFQVLYADAKHESNGHGIGRATDHNNVPWLCREGVWVPDLKTVQENDILADPDYDEPDAEIVEQAVFDHLSQRVDEGSLSTDVAYRIHDVMVERATVDPSFLALIQEGQVYEAAKQVKGRPVQKATAKVVRLRNASTADKRIGMLCSKCVYYDAVEKGNCTILSQIVKPTQLCDAYARTAVALTPKKNVVGAVSTPLGTLAIISNKEGDRYSAVIKEALEEAQGKLELVKKARGNQPDIYKVLNASGGLQGFLEKLKDTATETHPWKAFGRTFGGAPRRGTALGAFFKKDGGKRAAIKAVMKESLDEAKKGLSVHVTFPARAVKANKKFAGQIWGRLVNDAESAGGDIVGGKEGQITSMRFSFKTTKAANSFAKLVREPRRGMAAPQMFVNMGVKAVVEGIDEASSSSQDDYILVDAKGTVIKNIMPMKINPEEVAVENARLKSRGFNGTWVHYTRVLRGADKVTQARQWYKSPLPEGSSSNADDYVLVDGKGRIISTIMPMKIKPEDVPKENKRLKERGINGKWVNYTKVKRGAGSIRESSGSMEDDYILVDAKGKPVPSQSPQKLAPEEAKAMTKARKDGHKYVKALRSQLEALEESSSSGNEYDYVLVDGQGKVVPNFSPQKLTPEEAFARNRLLTGGQKYVLALRSRLQGAAHVSNTPPTRMKLIGEGHGLRRKTFPLDEALAPSLSLAEIAKLKDAAEKLVKTATGGKKKYYQAVLKGKRDEAGELLKTTAGKHARRAMFRKAGVPHTPVKESIDEATLYDKGDGSITSKFQVWSVTEAALGGTLVRIGEDAFSIDCPLYEVHAAIQKIAEFYGDLPEEFDMMVEAFLREFCMDKGDVVESIDAVSIDFLESADEGGSYRLKESRDARIAYNSRLRLLALEGVDDVVLVEGKSYKVTMSDYKGYFSVTGIKKSGRRFLANAFWHHPDFPAKLDDVHTQMLLANAVAPKFGKNKENADTAFSSLNRKEALRTISGAKVTNESTDDFAHLLNVMREAKDPIFRSTIREAKMNLAGASDADIKKFLLRALSNMTKAMKSRGVIPPIDKKTAKFDRKNKRLVAANGKMALQWKPTSISLARLDKKGKVSFFGESLEEGDMSDADLKRWNAAMARWEKATGLGEAKITTPPGVGPEPTKWSKADKKKVIAYYAKWPLKKLRKHQDLIISQQKRAGSNEKAMKRLQVIELLLAAAVDKVAFGESLDEELRLTKSSKAVIDAFVDKKSATSKKLDTDGKSLDGNWMGGKGIATWEGGKIKIHDLGGRASQTVARELRRAAPKNLLVKESLDEAKYYKEGTRVLVGPEKTKGVIKSAGGKKHRRKLGGDMAYRIEFDNGTAQYIDADMVIKESLDEKAGEPTHLKSLASKAGVSFKRAKGLWAKAQDVVQDQYPDIEKKSARYYQAATGIMKKMMKLPTKPLPESADDFDEAETFIIEQYVTPGSMSNFKAVIAASKKKPSLGVSNETLKKAWTDMVAQGTLAPAVGDLYQYEPIFWSGSQGTVQRTVGASVDTASTLSEATKEWLIETMDATRQARVYAEEHQQTHYVAIGEDDRFPRIVTEKPEDHIDYYTLEPGKEMDLHRAEATRSTSLLRKAGINAKTGRHPVKMRRTRDLARGPQKSGGRSTRYGEDIDEAMLPSLKIMAKDYSGKVTAMRNHTAVGSFKTKKDADGFASNVRTEYPNAKISKAGNRVTISMRESLDEDSSIWWKATFGAGRVFLQASSASAAQALAAKWGKQSKLGRPDKVVKLTTKPKEIDRREATRDPSTGVYVEESINESVDPADPVSIKEVLNALVQAEGRIDYNLFVQSFTGHKQASINGAVAELVEHGFLVRQSNMEHGNVSHDLVLTPQGFERSLKLNEDGYQHDMLLKIQANLSTTEKLDDESELFWREVLGEGVSSPFDEGTTHVQVVDKLNDRMIQDVRGGAAVYKKMVKKYGKRSKQYVIQMVDVDTDKVLKATESLDEGAGTSIQKLMQHVPFSLRDRKEFKDAQRLMKGKETSKHISALANLEDLARDKDFATVYKSSKSPAQISLAKWKQLLSSAKAALKESLDEGTAKRAMKKLQPHQLVDLLADEAAAFIESGNLTSAQLLVKLEKRVKRTITRTIWKRAQSELGRRGYGLNDKERWIPESIEEAIGPPATRVLKLLRAADFSTTPGIHKFVKDAVKLGVPEKRAQKLIRLKNKLRTRSPKLLVQDVVDILDESIDEAVSQVAKTIHQQIGRKAFVMMGAKDVVADKKALQWRVGKNAKGVTKVRVTLTPADLYDVEFFRIRKKGGVPEVKLLKKVRGVHVDNLRSTIENNTGLRLSL